jgi:DegV family protein with EDD domain
VGIVTDSASDLPEEVVRAHGIKVVPLVLVRGVESYRDGVDITAEDFHRALREGGDLPTTSQPPPAAFLEAFRRAAEEAEEVVGILVGSNLSGTFRSAEAAAFRFDDARVYLVDSLGASLLQGLLVLKATELAELALPPMEILKELRRIRERSGVVLTVDSLDRLVASGRLGKGKAWLASLLGIRPILKVPTDGRPVVPVGKALGRGRMLPALLEAVWREIPPGARRLRFGIIHVGVPEVVPRISEALRSRFGEVEILSSPATPVLATHTGIGAFAVAFLVED